MISTNLFSINIIILALGATQGVLNSNDFKILKNQYINIPVSESGLISSVYKPSRMQCITLCSTNTNCLTAMYDNSHNKLNNCFTYRKYFQTRELIQSSSGVVYEKKSSMIYINFIILHLKTFNPKLKI
jgi:hypothetical protein